MSNDIAKLLAESLNAKPGQVAPEAEAVTIVGDHTVIVADLNADGSKLKVAEKAQSALSQGGIDAAVLAMASDNKALARNGAAVAKTMAGEALDRVAQQLVCGNRKPALALFAAVLGVSLTAGSRREYENLLAEWASKHKKAVDDGSAFSKTTGKKKPAYVKLFTCVQIASAIDAAAGAILEARRLKAEAEAITA